MDRYYLEDMLELTKRILNNEADTHEFTAFDRDDLIAYVYGHAEIDTYLPGHSCVKL